MILNNKKRIVIILLAIIGFFVLVFPSQRHPKQANPIATLDAQANTKVNPKRYVRLNKNVPTSVSHVATLNRLKYKKAAMPVIQQPNYPTKLTAYLAYQHVGIIGVYDGKQLDNPADNIFTVKLDYLPTLNDKVWLNYNLTGLDDNSNVVCSVNDRQSFGGYLAKKDTKTKRQRVQINSAWLQKGENRIQFGLPENVNYGYRISDFSIEVERGTNELPLAVNAGYSLYNSKAYIHGFIQDASGNTASVTIDGKAVSVRDGEFETIIKTDNKLETEIKAHIKGKIYSKTIHFKRNTEPDVEFALQSSIPTTAKTFVKGYANTLQTSEAQLKVGDKALLATQKMSLTTLRNIDLPALDMGMTNVTQQSKGFRFLPHGEHFTNGATVALKYDRTKIPDGYTENDIKTFYFDNTTNHWVALERDTVDKALCMVISKTTHFTDMINGVIKTPESPETQGFTPTMMNDIKAANPTSKIELITPPTANNSGSANLSYSLEMPPARNGMSPQLAISYNSDGGSGWLGEGWDLNVPAISVDTRWGVPIYHPDLESETYSFYGTQLARTYISPSFTDEVDEEMFLPGRGTMYTRNKPLPGYPNDQYQFYPRVETDFPLITRMGTDIDKYKWKVENKNGIKYYYGYDYADNTPATLSDGGNRIAEWKLQSMVDIHGDSIAYSYNKTTEEGYGDLNPKAIYLSKIECFTIVDGVAKKHTEVALTNRGEPKLKKTNNGRYGFLVSNQKLLEKVEIRYANDQGVLEKVRSYAFNYRKGEFSTDLLESVSQLDSADQVVGNHTFDYYDDVLSSNATNYVMASPYQYNYSNLINNENSFQKLLRNVASAPLNTFGGIYNPLNKGLLNNSITTNIGASLYLGLGLGSKASRSLSFGVTGSYQHTDTKGKTSLIDINGDGISDNVFRDGNNLYYNQGYLNSDGNLSFNTTGKILTGAPGLFLHSSSDNITLGLLADFKAVSGRFDKDLTNTSSTDVYLSDVNGDGLVDIVYYGCVYFNRLVNGEPVFNRNSNLTEMPMNSSTLYNTQSATAGLIRYKKGEDINESEYQLNNIDIPDVKDLITFDNASEDTLKAEQSPLQDMVRVWVAPYTGTVKITGDIQLLAPTGRYDSLAYEYADGVRVAIQKEKNELWSKKIAKSEIAPVATDLTTDIQKGDRLFFRVQSGDSLLSNGDFDDVLWAPVVEYTSIPDVPKTTDYLGYSNYLYNAKEGDVVEDLGYTEIDSGVPVKIDVDIDMLAYPSLAVDVDLVVFSSNYPTQFQDTLIDGQKQCNLGYIKKIAGKQNIYRRIFCQLPSANPIPVKDRITFDIPKNTHKYFWFKLYSAKNEKWQNVKISPTIYYQSTDSATGAIIYDTIRAGVKYPINYDTISVVNPSEPDYRLNENQEYIDIDSTFIYASLDYSNSIQHNSCNNSKLNIYKFVLKDQDGFFSSFITFLPYSDDNSVCVFWDYGIKSHQRCKSSVYFYDEDSNISMPSVKMYTEIREVVDITDNRLITCLQTDLYKLVDKEPSPYGPMLRNWGQFQYNAAEGRYAKPLDIDSLLPRVEMDSNIVDMDMNRLIRLNPDMKTKKYWAGSTENVKISGDTIQSGRLYCNNVRTIIMPNVTQADPADESSQSQQAKALKSKAIRSGTSRAAQYLISAPPIISKQKNSSFSGNISLNILPKKLRNKILKKLNINIGASFGSSSGKIEKTLDYMDFNGDGFPDYFKEGKIYYSNSHGTTASITNTCKDCKTNSVEDEKMSTAGLNIGVSAGILLVKSSTVDEKGCAVEQSSSISASGSVSSSSESLQVTFSDINGDGLPDMINHNDGKVSLNLGYSFSAPVDFDLYKTRTKTYGANAGLGAGKDKDRGGWSMGVGIGASLSSTENRLIDINGDGLPDIVSIASNSVWAGYNLLNYVPQGELKVQLNNGNGFDPKQTWNSSLWSEKTIASCLNANAGFTLRIPIIPFIIKFVINPCAQAGITNSKGMEDIRDMNADGYPDFVTTDLISSTATVKYSAINRTNKLKTVANPIGGKFRLDYTRSLPTIYHPNGKWVMKSLEINDGIADDEESMPYREFIYKNGKYNRREKQFDGFGSVTTKDYEFKYTFK
jgi:hypothetical protein